MHRRLSRALVQWKGEARRKPLILRGARQVGKTWLLVDFGRTHFPGRTHLVDFEKRPAFRTVFERDLEARRIVTELELLLNERITPGEDLLVLDEIQACPRAIMALRYFYEDLPALHVAAAGSLLEFTMQDLSFPVGRARSMTMRAMTFAEFLHGLGNHAQADLVTGPAAPVAPAIHNEIMQLLKTYFIVGGMPESVRTFAETGSIRSAKEVLTDLIVTYRDDFGKYAPRADKLGMNAVLRGAAAGVGDQIKYSRLTDLVSGPTSRRDLELLQLAQLVHKIRATSAAVVPLAASASDSRFKVVMLDIGIMQALSGLNADAIVSEDDLLAVYRGALAEQFVGQELLAGGQDELYFWSREARSSSAEVDFLATVGGRIRPIEVKSSAAGRLRSLHLLLETFPACRPGYVLSSRPYAELPEQDLVFAPLYFAGSLARE
ncbi:MAG: ATP-binding protein [Actinobacteria bacterium]|nr:ATP-binding protein [Actinomycetota bacterium]